MTLIKIILLSLILFWATNIYSQQKCSITDNFQTVSIGNEQEQLPIKMIVNFTKDSIIMFYDEKTRLIGDSQAFIIKSQRCEWDKDSTTGILNFDLILFDKGVEKHPSLKLIFSHKKAALIELQYEEKEKIVMRLMQE